MNAEPRRRRSAADRAAHKGPAAIPQLPPRRVRNPYPPMQLLSADQVEAIHEASLHILENFGIEVMSPRALALFEKAGAAVDHATMTVRLDRGLVAEALKTAPAAYSLTPRNADHAVHLGGAGRLGGGVLLQDHGDLALGAHRLLGGLDRLAAVERHRQHDLREEHGRAHRDDDDRVRGKRRHAGGVESGFGHAVLAPPQRALCRLTSRQPFDAERRTPS